MEGRGEQRPEDLVVVAPGVERPEVGREPGAVVVRAAPLDLLLAPRVAGLAADHEVEAGRVELEIYSWWAAKGILARPKDPFDLRDAYLGLLVRPEDAPEFTEQELESLQRGHLENMQRMTEAGALVIAGPVEGGCPILG